jgi:hypothetical protein
MQAKLGRIEKYKAQEKAFLRGQENAQEMGLTKPYDIMVCIIRQLKQAGLMIVWQPGEKPPPGG